MVKSKILFLGFGSVGQAVAPLLLSHWKTAQSQVAAIAADFEGAAAAAALGIEHTVLPVFKENLDEVLNAKLSAGDLLINVSVHVSSKAVLQWCQAHDVLYLDTCVEPWQGGYLATADHSVADTTNYALREEVLSLRGKGKSTAVIAHGANPGVISHLAKAGLLELAAMRSLELPEGPNAFARLSQLLGVRVIQIAERDSQYAGERVREAFVNTWSVDGLIAEASQLAECGWGTHEKSLPRGAKGHSFGSQVGIYLKERGVETRVQSWVPSIGAQEAYLLTHHEALSLADLLTVPANKPEAPEYRPTVYYAYAPCEATKHSLDAWKAGNFEEPAKKHVLRDELLAGDDQLGVLFIFEGGAFWYGSTVELEQARTMSPCVNATSLQVVGGILGALDWMRANPREGVVEAEDLPHHEVLAVAMPYLGRVEGHWTSWQPTNKQLSGAAQGLQFSEFLV